MTNRPNAPRALELFAGAGGMSLGLEAAGFDLALAVESSVDAVKTLRLNRPHWDLFEGNVRDLVQPGLGEVDLVAAAMPSDSFSIAGDRRVGAPSDDLFPELLRVVKEVRPSAVLIENVRGFAAQRFADQRHYVVAHLEQLGYSCTWKLVRAYEYGLPQLRPRLLLVAVLPGKFRIFNWPTPTRLNHTVGTLLGSLMAERRWSGADHWIAHADGVAPTVVGGSPKHGGADLGPTRTKQSWLALGVDGRGIADMPPGPDDPELMLPRLTNRMVATLQGFDLHWEFVGKKTSVYRQIGNASNPPVFEAVGRSIRLALSGD